MLSSSIRVRVQAWHGATLTLVIVVLAVTGYQWIYVNRMRVIDDELQRRMSVLASAIPPGPSTMEPSGDLSAIFDPNVNAGERDTYDIIWTDDGRVLTRSSNAPKDIARPDRSDNAARMRGSHREFVLQMPLGGTILVGRQIDGELAQLRRLALTLVVGSAMLIAFGLAGGWWLATRAIRPIEEISATAARIAAGDLSRRISTGATDNEFDRLASVLNATFARLEAAFSQQARLTSDVSHELRTPIAVIVSEAQTALARERTAQEYRETLEGCLEAAQEMARLTAQMLELARFDAGDARMPRERVDLADAVTSCAERIQPLAAERGVRIRCDAAPAKVQGDPERLGRLVKNLLVNAVEYNVDNGEIRVRTHRENGESVLTVEDTGIGIAPEDLPRVFERFFRADKSRGGPIKHFGLGLAICKAIVEAHGGSIALSSRIGAGTTVIIRLPG